MKGWPAKIAPLILLALILLPLCSAEDTGELVINYGERSMEEYARYLEVEIAGNGIHLKFLGRSSIDLNQLPAGTYEVWVRWMGVEVGRYVFQVGPWNLAINLPVALSDFSIEVRDLEGRTIRDVNATVSPPIYGRMKARGGVITVLAAPSTMQYTVKLRWSSREYGTDVSEIVAATPEGFSSLRTIKLPVGDVKVRVVDVRGDPVSGAFVRLGEAEARTDSQGTAFFQQVPLESDGKPIEYGLGVEVNGSVVYVGSVELSRSRRSVAVVAELYDLKVRVEGAAGQPLPYAKITLKKLGAELGTFQTDEGGVLIIHGLPRSEYVVEAEWRGYRGSAIVTPQDLELGRMALIVLPPYTTILGKPLTIQELIALIASSVLIIVLIALFLIEYNLWRARRLLIRPPKKSSG